MFGECKDDRELKLMWEAFCDELKSAGELIFADGVPAGAVDRTEGLRFIARNIPLAMAFQMENCDPSHPELMRYFTPDRKQGGDNSDAVYLGAPIDGQRNYRISGFRGDARYLAITVLETGDTPWGGKVIGSLFKDQLQCDDNGNFELFIGPDQRPGNYIKSTENTFRVTIRQFFADWQNESPMQARIDCLRDESPPPPITAAELADRLQKTSHWLKWSTRYWAEKLSLWQRQPNRFTSWGEMEKLPIDATPGGTPLICYWQLPEDEVLIIDVTPPQCSYWNCEFGNYWFCTVDYRYRLSGTNCHYAALNSDGSVTIVVSHADPLHTNWLDPAGHSAGYITFRWIGADSLPVPRCRQVKYSALKSELPEGFPQTDSAGRILQVRERRRGTASRFTV